MSAITLQMTPQELQQMIESAVENALDLKFSEWFDDLDEDGELRPEVEEQLLRLRQERLAGNDPGVPLSVVIEELGLDLSSES
ncbi:MAG: hypothetical protein HF973_08490 [Chloroflexi bacterium]|nr:hypothetical protein [Chloroflexota bacterium]